MTISPEDASQMSDQELTMKVSSMLGDSHYLLMSENDKRTNGYPVTREEMLEFVDHRWRELVGDDHGEDSTPG